jgi:hypothetical protein
MFEARRFRYSLWIDALGMLEAWSIARIENVKEMLESLLRQLDSFFFFFFEIKGILESNYILIENK